MSEPLAHNGMRCKLKQHCATNHTCFNLQRHLPSLTAPVITAAHTHSNPTYSISPPSLPISLNPIHSSRGRDFYLPLFSPRLLTQQDTLAAAAVDGFSDLLVLLHSSVLCPLPLQVRGYLPLTNTISLHHMSQWIE